MCRFPPCSCSVSCGLLSASAGCKCPSLNWGSSRQWALVVSSPAWQHGWAMLWYFIYIGMTLSYFSYLHYIYQNQNVCFIVTEYCCSTTAQCSHIMSPTWYMMSPPQGPAYLAYLHYIYTYLHYIYLLRYLDSRYPHSVGTGPVMRSEAPWLGRTAAWSSTTDTTHYYSVGAGRAHWLPDTHSDGHT